MDSCFLQEGALDLAAGEGKRHLSAVSLKDAPESRSFSVEAQAAGSGFMAFE